MILTLRQFNQGLVLSPSPETIPHDALYSARGIHPIERNYLRSRNGNESLLALGAHSIYRFGDVWFAGVDTYLYRSTMLVKSGLNGNDLSFVRMPPQPGLADSLFCSGGGALFKVDSVGTATNWGIAAPSYGSFAAAKGSAKTKALLAMDNDAGNWVADNCTIANEGTIKIEGAGSLKVTIDENEVCSITRDCSGSPLDLSEYAGSVEVAPEDYIVVWMHIIGPQYLEEVALDVGSGSASASASLRSSGTTLRIGTEAQGRVVDGIDGLASADFFWEEGQEEAWKARYDPTTADAHDKQRTRRRTIGMNLARITYDRTSSTWQPFYIPRHLFVAKGPATIDWSDIQVVRFRFKSNKLGDPIVYIDNIHLHGGYGLVGDYKYHVCFANSTTGSRSNPDTTAGPVEVSGCIRQPVSLTNIPQPTDTQADKIEIWRTIGDGALFWLAQTLDTGTTSWTDDVADIPALDTRSGAEYLGSSKLTYDNAPPESHFTDCAGPHNGSVFWISGQSGQRGRLFYSPPGRPESYSDFIEVTDDDDPCQRVIRWNGALYVYTEAHVYQIVGTDPYVAREVFGVPGVPSSAKATVIPTPYGIYYQALDGIRGFDGMRSTLAVFDAVGILFRGESASNLTAFEGVDATYARDEYIVSDGSQTLALDLRRGVWRDIGVGCAALYAAPDVDIIAATVEGIIVELEKEGEVDDDGDTIPFEIETAHLRLGDDQLAFVEQVFIDIDTGSQSVVPSIILDDLATTLTVMNTAGRRHYDRSARRIARRFGLRVAASLMATVKLYAIKFDVRPVQLAVRVFDPQGNHTTTHYDGRLMEGDAGIEFDVPNASELLSLPTIPYLRRLYLDLHSAGNAVTPVLEFIDETVTLGSYSNTSREAVDHWNIHHRGHLAAVRITGDFTQAIQLRKVEIDVYET